MNRVGSAISLILVLKGMRWCHTARQYAIEEASLWVGCRSVGNGLTSTGRTSSTSTPGTFFRCFGTDLTLGFGDCFVAAVLCDATFAVDLMCFDCMVIACL